MSRIASPSAVATPSGSVREFELYDELMPVRRYKMLLQAFLKRRGSGSRQAIAEALGNTRSFITQITSPAYDLAIPAHHVRTIVKIAGLQPNEERMFLDAYIAAHPERASEILGRGQSGPGSTTMSLTLPQLSNPAAQRRLEALIERFARDVAATMIANEADTGGHDDQRDLP
ncbi:hypothetical protein [Chelatococcus asaccharovorans]|uniref:Uncharacterized protein n=1 Tax=Chelatococcus asaccharovorans TaxID=28210 RepID=A0A2V3UD24_9HYPH|nr:hypothetical protein [Chelatococcus asaccharovorans]MBS7706943.1 hypothetical protein [Chelatococcus asaccharovorans]PXW63122.1 hypothetical protein C7450_10237 [Chelatococcus asaccharovorans]CAH1653853.1 conserved hypothetical protein [Chelatococcus asaccharovorans]CAH1694361.1 conserved hypothetical protein [Chelatococcus asaccharovorans]